MVTFFPTFIWFKWYFTPFRFIQFYKLWILQSSSWGFGVKLQWTHFLGTTGQWLTMVKRSVQMALLFTVKTGLALKLVANKPTSLQLEPGQNKMNIKVAFINKSSTALLNQLRGLFQSRLMLVFFGWADICKICNTFGLINVRTRNRLIWSDWGLRTDRPADVLTLHSVSLQANTWLVKMFVQISPA